MRFMQICPVTTDGKIDAMIVGAQKSGTTSLLRYLSQHPMIEAHLPEEFSFFVRDAEYELGIESAFTRFFTGTDFSDPKVVVAKNAGMCYNEVALGRLKNHHPGVIVIMVIRNPVDRAWSSYS